MKQMESVKKVKKSQPEFVKEIKKKFPDIDIYKLGNFSNFLREFDAHFPYSIDNIADIEDDLNRISIVYGRDRDKLEINYYEDWDEDDYDYKYDKHSHEVIVKYDDYKVKLDYDQYPILNIFFNFPNYKDDKELIEDVEELMKLKKQTISDISDPFNIIALKLSRIRNRNLFIFTGNYIIFAEKNANFINTVKISNNISDNSVKVFDNGLEALNYLYDLDIKRVVFPNSFFITIKNFFGFCSS